MATAERAWSHISGPYNSRMRSEKPFIALGWPSKPGAELTIPKTLSHALFLGFGKKHHLVPVEAIDEESAGSVTLKVDQQAVERAPTLTNPKAEPDEELQRAAHEHYGLGAVL
jgi:hypothetical protein